jgi:hypothetical protein
MLLVYIYLRYICHPERIAPGCARTASVTPSATARIMPPLIPAIPSRGPRRQLLVAGVVATARACQTAPSPCESASRPLQSPAQNPRSSPSKARSNPTLDAPPPTCPATSRKLRKHARVTSSATPHGAIVISPAPANAPNPAAAPAVPPPPPTPAPTQPSSPPGSASPRSAPAAACPACPQPHSAAPPAAMNPRIHCVKQLRRPRRLVDLQMPNQMHKNRLTRGGITPFRSPAGQFSGLAQTPAPGSRQTASSPSAAASTIVAAG